MSASNATPDSSENYYMPAEWAPQEAVWLSWPANRDSAPETHEVLQAKFGEIAAAITKFEPVRINAAGDWHKRIWAAIEAQKGDMSKVELYEHPTNDVWCRDHGPIFVKHKEMGKLALTDWQFNAWGGKFPPWNLDNEVPERVARALDVPRFSSPMILEGGSIEVNGDGVLLTTEAVLLNKNRNRDWSRKEIEAEIKRHLGISSIFWLREGIEGDDTDGHIDDITRFIREDVVLTMVEKRQSDANYRILEENREKLADLRTTKGGKVEVLTLEMPEPLVPKAGWRLDRLPGSYANFLIVNGGVLVPVFDQGKRDDHALGFIRECFPGREVIGIESSDIVFEGGALHCISQQQPR
ncbi:agmatine deiminase family protein [Verrucomicrobium sp. BvORR034]|uniref:agmatine deiminase family protein n=1 Tax=Verrucomicrobium sp. BvORR034 TaxID=1396418 RepID=UPI00067864C8|nr:agmatine deiminase family protein [Verrucomicrobium sp. BvORR034]